MQSPDDNRKQARLTWLAEMYRAYATDLQRYIYSKVGESFLAEDLTSTVFLKALRWLREDQSGESARGWLYATARTTIVDHWLTMGQYETRTLAGLEDMFSSQLESLEPAQQQAELRVQHLLSLLPERERRVLNLRFLQGYSAAEIAAALGTNAGHIRVLQLRALRHAAQLESQERNVYTMQEQGTPFDSFVKFLSPESLRVLELSREEALNLKHTFIGTEHLLWGLASEGSLAPFLTAMGITPERIHAGVVFIYDRYAQSNLPGVQETLSADTQPEALKLLTPRAKQTIILAGNEAKSQGEHSIRPAHLLLGLMNEGEGIGAGLLRSLGISLLQVRTALAPPIASQTCSFCGRTGSLIKHFFPAEASVGGSTPSTCICDRCVEQFHALLQQS
jgi:RNA polymerase sigma factor (sigma-70 family)